MKSVLILGGAGFVGSSLALNFKKTHPSARIVALDNLKRRGSELNLVAFKEKQIEFVHGDVRVQRDLADLTGNFDLVVDASAEPSVLAGLNGNPEYLLQTNLQGTLNALDFARNRAERFLFLSTSRVYSIAPLKELPLVDIETRLDVNETLNGVSFSGVKESFPTHLPRSLYGASKLASELFVQEYAQTYGLKAIINRCGVIAGPGQFGKVDQGVFTLWVAKHFFGQTLTYTGFGGDGKQVRDLLHPEDLFSLLEKQLKDSNWNAGVFNVGGGRECNTSLKEFTAICQNVTGRTITLDSNKTTSSVDIPWFISDNEKVSKAYQWKPQATVEKIVRDIFEWLKVNERILRPCFS